jgi:hypothetical protein
MKPTVQCVMLANGRPEMVARAIKSFLAQTYHGARLLVYDTSRVPLVRDRSWGIDWATNYGHVASIGALRNQANACANGEIILHWDSDDWSHQNRIAEQVALLQSSGAECVGYGDMLFWETPKALPPYTDEQLKSFGEYGDGGAAWIYRAAIPNYAIGTSMCYWRQTWEHNPFPDRSEGCDDLDWFHRGVKIHAVSSSTIEGYRSVPVMIASIHGSNTCAKIDAKQREWTRTPQWDAFCREAMKL